MVVERGGAGGGVGVHQPAHAALLVREADAHRQALAQRTRGHLDAVGVAVLRVARGPGSLGAQPLDVLDLEPGARGEQLQVLDERGVARGEDEAIPALPAVVRGVQVHDVLVQLPRHGGQRDRGAGVAVPGLLHGVRRERLERVHHPAVLLRVDEPAGRGHPVQGRGGGRLRGVGHGFSPGGSGASGCGPGRRRGVAARGRRPSLAARRRGGPDRAPHDMVRPRANSR